MSSVKAKKVAGIFILPGIMPRARAFLGSGFGYIAFLMASIYNMVRLLPDTHPYVNPENIGRYGIRHVIGEAANHLVISRQNIDQIFVFVALLAGVVILLMQILLLLYTALIQPVIAQSLFDTPRPEKDIALMMLDYVFGVKDLYCNHASVCTEINADLPFPFHEALHDMLTFYSYGLLLVAVLIFLYFVVVLVGETATTGSPFGKRFQNIWAPIRLVIALGLLVPINYGLNTSQYIVLYAAKYGSGFATNGWTRFNNALAEQGIFTGGGTNPSGERSSLLALPESPDIAPTIQYMSMVHACRYAYWREQDPPPDVSGGAIEGPENDFFIKAYLVKQPQPWMNDARDFVEVTPGLSYVDALDFFDNSDIQITFGDRKDTHQYPGKVEPKCGDIRIHTADLSMKGSGKGTDKVQNFYFDMIKTLYGLGAVPNTRGDADKLKMMSYRATEQSMQNGDPLQCKIGCDIAELPSCSGNPKPCDTGQASLDLKQTLLDNFQAMLNTTIVTAWQDFNENTTEFEMSEEVLNRGWGGAGIWYNSIARLNGTFISAIINIPRNSKLPLVMEQVRAQKYASDNETGSIEQFNPSLAGDREIKGVDNVKIAKSLYGFMRYWYEDGLNQAKPDKAMIGNFFEVAMNLVFGTNGLFAMRGENAHIHPLSQLTALGKGLVDSALINVGISLGAATGIFGRFGFGPLAEIAGNVLSTTAFVGLTAGIVLYYILPFLPFVYFFFAVAQWVKGIFEAMVGAPLWALAHMRIDGEGLPGDAATNGYFLVFEVFARPIMIVFGLIAAMVIFTAQVRILNFSWTLVVDNLTGFDKDITLGAAAHQAQQNSVRGIIDQFFFTIIYAIIVYMLATASFKLIDKIPDDILRWMGAGVSSFGDTNKDDPTQGLTRYVAIGGMTIGQQAVGGAKELAGGLGTITGIKPTPQKPPQP